MKKTILGLGLIFILASIGLSQTSSTASVSGNNDSIGLQSGTQIAAQLQNSIDVQKVKVGDQVVLKTTGAIKQNGKTVIDKGAILFGHITEVQQKTKSNPTSKIGILFDRLQQRGNQFLINATITSITQVQTQASSDDSIDSDVSGSSSTNTSTTPSNNSNGGFIHGVGNAVGSAINATTRTVGKVANAAGQTVKNTAQDVVGGTLKNVQISQSTDASANGGSTLSLPNGNLHLYKGVTFNLSVSESSTIRSN